MNTPPEDQDIIQERDTDNVRGSDDTDELDDSVVGEENAVALIKKLRERLRKAETEKQEYLTGWQRSKAEMVNARKRDEEERKDFTRYANAGFIVEWER